MQNKTLKRTGNLIATIFFIFITLGMMQGTVQNHIQFAGVLNEIGFTFMSLCLTLIFAYQTVSE
jgi:hypothetical protein